MLLPHCFLLPGNGATERYPWQTEGGNRTGLNSRQQKLLWLFKQKSFQGLDGLPNCCVWWTKLEAKDPRWPHSQPQDSGCQEAPQGAGQCTVDGESCTSGSNGVEGDSAPSTTRPSLVFREAYKADGGKSKPADDKYLNKMHCCTLQSLQTLKTSNVILHGLWLVTY